MSNPLKQLLLEHQAKHSSIPFSERKSGNIDFKCLMLSSRSKTYEDLGYSYLHNFQTLLSDSLFFFLKSSFKMPMYSRFSACTYLPIQSHLLSALNSTDFYAYLTTFTFGLAWEEEREISQIIKIHPDSNHNFSNTDQ